jgi:DNA polymerase III sliding clamp (beta) subunit (PCNA family)
MKIKDLRLALSATPKKADVRYYLNGINVTKHNIVGSTGHVLCHICTYTNEIPNNHENIIVPTDTVKALLKKIGSKHENLEVAIFLINDRYELSCMNQVEVFAPIDHKYPDFTKLIDEIITNNHDKSLNAIKHQFDWDYVSVANKAICNYMSNTAPKRLYSFEKCGYFMPSDDIIYIIMPVRN